MDIYSQYQNLNQPGSFDPDAHNFLKEHGLLHEGSFSGTVEGHAVDLRQWVEEYPQHDDDEIVIVWCGEVTITPANQ